MSSVFTTFTCVLLFSHVDTQEWLVFGFTLLVTICGAHIRYPWAVYDFTNAFFVSLSVADSCMCIAFPHFLIHCAQPTLHRGTDHYSSYLKRAPTWHNVDGSAKSFRLLRWSSGRTSTATKLFRQGLAGGLEYRMTRVPLH